MTPRYIVMQIGLVLGLAGACFDPSAQGLCPTGSDGCKCTNGGTCDAGLACLSDICVPASSTETNGEGEGDADADGNGDGDGDADGEGDGDGDGDGDSDADMDGVDDSSDNCPEIPNPNQRDFNNNGLGNMCDVHMFTNINGFLHSTAIADAGFGGQCQIPIEFMVTGGEVRIQLDDDAALAAFEIVSLHFADILDQQCMLAISTEFSFTNFNMTNSGDAFPVSVPHTPAAHDAGSIAGDSDMPHPVLSTAVFEVSSNGGEPVPNDLMLDSTLPVFTADVSNAGAMGTLAWADAQFVLAMDTFMITDPIPIEVDLELRGLVGSIVLMP